MLGGAETSNLHWESEIGNWQCVGMSLISPQSSEERYLKDYLIGKNLRLYHLLIDIYSFYVVIDLFSIFCPWLTLKMSWKGMTWVIFDLYMFALKSEDADEDIWMLTFVLGCRYVSDVLWRLRGSGATTLNSGTRGWCWCWCTALVMSLALGQSGAGVRPGVTRHKRQQ